MRTKTPELVKTLPITSEEGKPHQRQLKDFSIFYQNVRGLRSKVKDFHDNILANNFDIICITETWLNNSIHDRELCDERYLMFRNDKLYEIAGVQRGGGVLCCVKKKFQVLSVCKSEDVDFQWLCTTLKINEFIIAICCIYIKSGSSLSVYERVLDSFESNNDLYSENVYLIGDFNIPEINGIYYNFRNGSTKARVIQQIMCRYDLYMINNVLNHVDNTLDLVLTNMTEAKLLLSDMFLVNIDQYHPPLEISFGIITNNKIVDKAPDDNDHNYDFKKGDYIKLHYVLRQCNWVNIIQSGDINECTNQFYTVLYEALDKCVPHKKSYRVSNYPIWFSKELKKKIKTKERYHKKSKKDHRYTQTFRDLRREVKCLIKICHANYIQNIEGDINNNPKMFWEYIKTKRSNSSIGLRFSYNDEYFENEQDISNAFAKYFKSVYSNSTPLQGDFSFKDYNLDGLNVKDVSIPEIINAIKSLKPQAAVGVDGLPGYFFKAFVDILAVPLQLIFNRSLRTNTFPEAFKIGRVAPIHKSGNTSVITNYRAITVLSAPSKIFERVLYNRIYSHVSPVLIEEQHGFVNKKSTVTNLCIFSDYLAREINNAQIDTIYTDLAKAFDRVNHNILLEKLKSFSFDEDLIIFLKSYLTNRPNFVKFNNSKSDNFISTSGVPQGSILGPLLFVLFINDISDYIKYSSFLLYADDLKAYRVIRSPEDINKLKSDIQSISDFCTHNDLALNETKCKVVSYTRKKDSLVGAYTVNGVEMQTLNEIKDLGVVFSKNFSFSDHISQLVAECSRKIGFILRASHGFQEKTSIILFNTYVRSKLEYCCIIWNPRTLTYTEMLEKVQKKFLRSIYLRKHGIYPFLISYERQRCEFNVMLLSKRRENAAIVFIFNILQGHTVVPDILFSVNISVPDVRLRRRCNLFKVINENSPTEHCTSIVNAFLRQCEIDIFNISRNKLVSLL